MSVGFGLIPSYGVVVTVEGTAWGVGVWNKLVRSGSEEQKAVL